MFLSDHFDIQEAEAERGGALTRMEGTTEYGVVELDSISPPLNDIVSSIICRQWIRELAVPKDYSGLKVTEVPDFESLTQWLTNCGSRSMAEMAASWEIGRCLVDASSMILQSELPVSALIRLRLVEFFYFCD